MLLVLILLLLGDPLFFDLPAQTPGTDIVYSGPDVVLPKLTYRVEPTYTESAREAKMQGNVLMAVTIDEKGILRDPVILSSLGQALDEQALKCVSKWRFKPATKDNRPVKFRATIEVRFRLTPCSSWETQRWKESLCPGIRRED